MNDVIVESLRPPQLGPDDFSRIRKIAHTNFGIVLRPGKEMLVSARLGKHVRAGGFGSFRQYLDHLESDRTGAALATLIDALSTNHTSFLRGSDHFRFLVDEVLLSYGGRESINIWSAGCATGEEPYSILFTVLEALAATGRPSPRVLATDISTRALEIAARGVYSAEKVRVLPLSWLPRYLLRGEGRARGLYKVCPDVSTQIIFRHANLLDPFPAAMSYDVIFCRNVMIYFDAATRNDLVNRFATCLEPGGYLFVGHAESMTTIPHPLEYVRPAIYRKPVAGR